MLPPFLRIAGFMSAVAATLFASAVRADPLDLTTATIADIQEAVAAGDLTYESLCERYLERIAAFELRGPSIHSIITINPNWRTEARALDEERKKSGLRSQLHGIPMAVKDNIDTEDMPNTGGAIGLKHSYAEDDAFVIQRLKKAGAIIFLKTNLSEFASGSEGLPGASTLGGQPRNPYNLRRHSDGSSSGTGSALAAVFAVSGLGTETGSSVRGPSSANNLVGIAPTEGFISREGVIPLSTTLDRVGVMGRNVYDVAVTLTYTSGYDPADAITEVSKGKLPSRPYQEFLDKDSLKTARLGVIRELFTTDETASQEAVALMERALADALTAGATLVDPVESGYDDLMGELALSKVGRAELGPALDAYFKGLGERGGADSLEEFYKSGGFIIGKWERYQEALENPPAKDEEYKAQVARRGKMRQRLLSLMDENDLDALVYLHNNYPSQYVNEPSTYTKVRLSSVSGLPAIVVPAGITSLGQPVAIEFLGRAFDEQTLLSLAYSFEQATGHRTLPPNTPPLPTDIVTR